MVLAYDHDNHLTKVRRSTTTLVTFEYDALGRRMFMTDWTTYPMVTGRQYIYSGQNVVEEYDEPNHRACYYVHGPSYIDERVLMYDEASEADYVYLLKDLYTVAGLADARGWLVEAYDYDAYGKVTMRRCAVLPDAADYDADGDVDDADLAVFAAHENGAGNDPCDVTDPCMIPGWRSDFDGDGDVDGVDYIVFAHAYGGAGVSPRGERMLLSGPMPASRVANPYFFTGRRLDLLDVDDANTPNHFTDDTARLPLYYYRRRTMDPIVGRFAQRDPLGYRDGMNSYAYAGGAPSFATDPLGLKMTVKCCERMLSDTLWRSPNAAQALRAAMDHTDVFGIPCLRKVRCKTCSGVGGVGTYSSWSRNITICANNLTPRMKNTLRMTLIHEATHAYSVCGSFLPLVSCRRCMLEEMKAYYLANQCTMTEECADMAFHNCERGPCKWKSEDKYKKMVPPHKGPWPPKRFW